jgi:malate dehydrogenase
MAARATEGTFVLDYTGVTILPLFSQATPDKLSDLDQATIEGLTKRTQDGGTEVVQAKAGKVCAHCPCCYSMASPAH